MYTSMGLHLGSIYIKYHASIHKEIELRQELGKPTPLTSIRNTVTSGGVAQAVAACF